MKIRKIITIEKITFVDDRSFYIRDERKYWYEKKDAFSNNYKEVINHSKLIELEKAYQDNLEENCK